MRAILTGLVLLAACQTAQPAAAQTLSVQIGSGAEEIAARQCGSPVRAETVHDQANVITFRCLREEL